jgi:hypothetical protein
MITIAMPWMRSRVEPGESWKSAWQRTADRGEENWNQACLLVGQAPTSFTWCQREDGAYRPIFHWDTLSPDEPWEMKGESDDLR